MKMNLASFQKKVKTAGITMFLFAVLTGTIILGKTASNYFAKAQSCQTQNVTSHQVTTNGATISWESVENSQSIVEYGTNSANLTFSAPEGSSSKKHNISLSLLTPDTVYYYLIKTGDNRCDSSGQICTNSCVPWSFTTLSVSPQVEIEATNTPVPKLSPTSGEVLPTKEIVAQTSASQNNVCDQVRANIGASSANATLWPSQKQYDIDGNGVINGLDIIKCKQ